MTRTEFIRLEMQFGVESAILIAKNRGVTQAQIDLWLCYRDRQPALSELFHIGD